MMRLAHSAARSTSPSSSGPSFRISHAESLRRNGQLSALFLQPIGNGLGGVAKDPGKKRQDADLFDVTCGKAGIKGRDLDAVQAILRNGLQETDCCACRAKLLGRRSNDQQPPGRQHSPAQHTASAPRREAHRRWPGRWLLCSHERVMDNQSLRRLSPNMRRACGYISLRICSQVAALSV